MSEVIGDREFEQICNGKLNYITRRRTRIKVGQRISLYCSNQTKRIDIKVTEVDKSFFKGTIKFNVISIIGVD